MRILRVSTSPRPGLILALLAGVLAAPALAFDYLEHSDFTDRACRLAQDALAERAATDPEVARRYLALALTCPGRWDRPYCDRGYK